METTTPRKFKFFDQFTPEQLAAQSQRCADGLRRMLAKVEKTGKPLNGYTAEVLREKIAMFERQAAQ